MPIRGSALSYTTQMAGWSAQLKWHQPLFIVCLVFRGMVMMICLHSIKTLQVKSHFSESDKNLEFVSLPTTLAVCQVF